MCVYIIIYININFVRGTDDHRCRFVLLVSVIKSCRCMVPRLVHRWNIWLSFSSGSFPWRWSLKMMVFIATFSWHVFFWRPSYLDPVLWEQWVGSSSCQVLFTVTSMLLLPCHQCYCLLTISGKWRSLIKLKSKWGRKERYSNGRQCYSYARMTKLLWKINIWREFSIFWCIISFLSFQISPMCDAENTHSRCGWNGQKKWGLMPETRQSMVSAVPLFRA